MISNDPEVTATNTPIEATPLSDEQVAGVVGGVRSIANLVAVCAAPAPDSVTMIPYPGSPLPGGSGGNSGQPSSSGDEAGTLKGTAGPKGS